MGAAAVSVVAVGLRLALEPFVQGVQFITFFPAVLIVAYVWGTRPAAVTVLLCGAAGWYFFLTPTFSFRIERLGEAISLATYFAVSGLIALWVGGFRGALDRERATARQLQESEERFRTAADSSPALMWMSDAQAEIVFANQQYRDFFGVSAEKMLGSGWRAIVHPDDVEAFHAAFLEAFNKREPAQLEVRVVHPALGVRWLSCSGRPRYAQGEFVGYVGVNIDITDAKLAQAAVAAREAQLRAVLEHMPIGVIIARAPDGEIVVYNRAAETLMGHPILGATAEEYGSYGGIHADGSSYLPHEYPVAKALMGETVFAEEITYRRGDGKVTCLSVAAAPVRIVGDLPDVVVCTFTDISERKSFEEQQRLMINELNHRVKNTLAIVQAVAQQTFKPAVPFDEARRAFEGRIAALSNAHNVLTSESWEAAGLKQIAESAVAPLRSSASQIRIQGPEVRLAPKTAVSVAMALHELGTNAVKYGALSIPDGRVSIEWTSDTSMLRLEWRECGGPPVSPRARNGFGTRLLERALAAELKGEVHMMFEPEGLICRVIAPLPDAAA